MVGGQGTSWRAGEVVLKPLDMSLDALQWQADQLPSIEGHGTFRVAAPLRTASGDLVIEGWTAWPYLAGVHAPRRWKDIIATGEQFHAGTRSAPRPDFVAKRDDRWALADRYAWDEVGGSRLGPEVGPIVGGDERVRRLTGLRRPVDEPDQLVHGDLSGNVLFHPVLPPAIIDFSLYWRPQTYATAIVLIAALVWEGADPSLVAEIAVDHDNLGQHLVRALLFRIVTEHLSGLGRTPWVDADPYASAIKSVHQLAS